MGLLWGIPYLFIRVAVQDLSPSIVIFGRVTIGALILVPIALHRKTFGSALKGIKYIAIYTLTEIIGPQYLITNAERSITSGLTGLLIATVPIWSTIFTSMHGDKTVWHHKRVFGLVLGFIGVIGLVGFESFTGNSPLWAISSVLLAAIGYAYAVIMIRHKLPDLSSIAINAWAMIIAALFYAPFTFAQWPTDGMASVSANSIWAIVGLGVLCTAVAFIVFFEIMKEIGPARTSLVTYLNTAFAVLLGVLILNEPLTTGIAIGLPLVLIGSYFASRKPRSSSSVRY